MNALTLLISQLAGPTFLALGLGMFLNAKYYSDMMKNLKNQEYSLMLSSLVMIPLGMLMVMSHNLWGTTAEIIVSILGWALLVKGILMGLLPHFFHNLVDAIVSPALLRIGALVWIIGGGYLTWIAFSV